MCKKYHLLNLTYVLIFILLCGCGIKKVDTIRSPYSRAEVEGMDYETVSTAYKNAGFANISYTERKTNNIEKADTVAEVRIGDNAGKANFTTDTMFFPEDEVKISYYILESVDITMEIETIDNDGLGHPMFTVNANLPDKTIVRLRVYNDKGYDEEKELTIKEGSATSKEFSQFQDNTSYPLAGDYSVEAKVLVEEQEFKVRSKLGESGECLSGAFVKEDDNGKKYLLCESTYKSPYGETELASYIEDTKKSSAKSDVHELEKVLAESGYEDHFDFEIKDDEVKVKVWGDNVSVGAYTSSSGDISSLQEWNDMVEVMVTLQKAMQAKIPSSSQSGYDVTLMVVSELDKDKALLIINDGEVIYDVVNNIDKTE